VVLALDEQLGALLIEAIEPGTPLVASSAYPDLESIAELLSSLNASGVPDPSYPTVAWRVAHLFDSSLKLYERHPELTALVPPELYERGRVAIDPAPCLGDAAFDAVDLILWQADDVETIEARAERVAAATGTDAARLLGWCSAFAGMTALELASQGTGPRPRPEALLGLAARAPTD
jgi:streptomycin 6-kinase